MISIFSDCVYFMYRWIPSFRQRSLMLFSPRSPWITIRIVSSAVNFRRVLRLMSRIIASGEGQLEEGPGRRFLDYWQEIKWAFRCLSLKWCHRCPLWAKKGVLGGSRHKRGNMRRPEEGMGIAPLVLAIDCGDLCKYIYYSFLKEPHPDLFKITTKLPGIDNVCTKTRRSWDPI